MSGSAKIKFVDCPGVSLDAIGQVWGQKVERLQICGRGFDFRPDNGPDIDVEMGISEADLAGLVRFTGLNYLNIQNMPRITRLPALAHLQKLVELTLWFPLCDGVILDASQVTRLWSLSIYDPDTRSDESTNVSAAALRQLGNLRQLEKLEMQGVAASDEHFAFLADLPQLRTLNLLAGNKVTDAGLEHFRTLKNLEELGLCPDDGTDEGIARLQEALPKCNIRR
jgi:hypothetical protein